MPKKIGAARLKVGVKNVQFCLNIRTKNMETRFGLCSLPEPIYLYVSNGDSEGKNYCWYYHNPDTKVNTPEYLSGVCGYLTELRLTYKDFKGKESTKLDIVISADENYVIRTGVETNFSKTFLLAIALVEDLSKPLIIGCSAGEQNTVFCKVYYATSKSRVKADWNAHADWASIINLVKSRLNSCGGVNIHSEIEIPAQNVIDTLSTPTYDRGLLNTEIESIMKRKSISVETAKNTLFKLFNLRSRQQLTDEQLARFLDYLKMPGNVA